MSVDVKIDTREVCSYLTKRYKLPDNYGVLLQGLKTKIADALHLEPICEDKDGVDAILSSVATNTNDNLEQIIDVQIVKQILDVLTNGNEGKHRNFLNFYSSPHIKAWRGVLKAFQSENLHLGFDSQLTKLKNV